MPQFSWVYHHIQVIASEVVNGVTQHTDAQTYKGVFNFQFALGVNQTLKQGILQFFQDPLHLHNTFLSRQNCFMPRKTQKYGLNINMGQEMMFKNNF